jgi:septal ring factor EnvC (AmiA/AmiB activator)
MSEQEENNQVDLRDYRDALNRILSDAGLWTSGLDGVRSLLSQRDASMRALDDARARITRLERTSSIAIYDKSIRELKDRASDLSDQLNTERNKNIELRASRDRFQKNHAEMHRVNTDLVDENRKLVRQLSQSSEYNGELRAHVQRAEEGLSLVVKEGPDGDPNARSIHSYLRSIMAESKLTTSLLSRIATDLETKT